MNTEILEFILLYVLLCIVMLRLLGWTREKIFFRIHKEDDFFSKRNSQTLDQYYKMFLTVLEIMILMVCLSLNISDGFFVKDETDISIKIESIAKDLAKSSSQLSVIQEELENRIEYVEELKNEAEIAENVISLTDEQVSAVQAKLNEELNASSGKSLIQSFLISTFFFVFGLLTPQIANWIRRKQPNNHLDDKKTVDTSIYSQEELEQAIKLLNTVRANASDNFGA